MTIDLAGYFARIGYAGSADPTLAVLRELVTAHTRSIPFENLDPLMGVPVDDLGPEALTEKLVHRRRGGYCYEQNGLMGHMLEGLGFGVRRFVARVLWTPGPVVPSQTHTLLAVTPPGTPELFVVDVGFGGQTLTAPIRLETGSVQQTPHEPYRLQERRDALVLQAHIRGEWQSMYEFTTRSALPIDLKVGSWYVSTHPSSLFVNTLMAALITDDGRCNLSGRHLSVHGNGKTEKIELPGAAEVVDVLVDRFGINVADVGERANLEARIAAVSPTPERG